HHHRYARGFETSHERLSNLCGEIFLDLQATRKDIDNARDFGKANHFPVGNVGDVHPTNEWKQMMLAQRIKLNVLDQNDLARVGFENSIVDDCVEVLAITLREKFQCARRAVRRASQTFAIQVLANAFQQLAICICKSGKTLFLKAIAFTRESFFEIKIGIAALNHGLCREQLSIKEQRSPLRRIVAQGSCLWGNRASRLVESFSRQARCLPAP